MGLNRAKAALLKRVRRFGAHEGGAVLAIAAIMLPVVVGGMGLGAETGYRYLTQRMLQHGADVSVHAGAVRKRAGDTKDKIDAAALNVVTASGFSPATGTLVVNIPPASGAFAGDPTAVEVLITDTRPRLLSSVFSKEPIVMKARAVAQVSTTGSVACLLALSPTAGPAVTVGGSTAVDLEGCEVASNSNAANSFLMDGSTAALSTKCVRTVGEAVTNTSLTLTGCAEVQEYAPKIRDPYAAVPEPAVTGTCRNKSVGSPNTSTTLTPTESHPSGVKVMRFCNGLDVKGAVTFGPGLYIIEGSDFTVNSGDSSSSSVASLTGSGVTFYFTNGGRSKVGGNATLDLAAPTSGPYSGILYFGSRSATTITHRVGGTSGSTMNGAIYAPASGIEFRGNSKTTGGCTQIIGGTITFTGNSSLKSSCTSAGTSDILTNEAVKIVE